MAQLSSDKSRVFFKKNNQKKFLQDVGQIMNISQAKMALLLSVHPRSLSDWFREKNSMSFRVLKRICFLAKIKVPKNIVIKGHYWYAKKGALLGAKALHDKYGGIVGDPEYRRVQWKKWWEKEGKYKSKIIRAKKDFRIPKKSLALAEFIGIMIGDGGISKYQFFITLNQETDKDYSLYVENLIWKLFKIKPRRFFKKNSKSIDIIVSRKKLNDYLVSIGLKSGNKLKQNLDIPEWIKKNKRYQKMCLRGLIDTDGCLFYEVHKINNKKYSYARLNFVTGSPILADSVMKILNDFNLNPKHRKNSKNSAIQIEKKDKICQYFKTIGTSNPKHLKRWHLY